VLRFPQLEILTAIVAAGGLRAAARAVRLSQAAVVKSLKTLEQSVGVPLLVRQSRGVELTPAGRACSCGPKPTPPSRGISPR
jgi:DNA-binding transcriptional LysR family regulator